MTASASLVVLRAAGTSVVLDVEGPGLPRVLHWGADLGDRPDEGVLRAGAPVPPSSLDTPWPLTLLPLREDGWTGSPGVEGHRSGHAAPWSLLRSSVQQGDDRLHAYAADPTSGVEVTAELVLEPSGVLRVRGLITNVGGDALDVAAVRLLMPLPPRAGEVLDQTGRWAREASPQRLPFAFGSHRRASRRGRSGHDGPLLLVAGTPGFGFRSGEVWGAHVAWSGDREHLAERLPEGAGGHAGVIGGGELLAPGEVRLAPGATYTSPWVHLVWSDAGLDGLSTRLHQMLRARPSHPRTPRPLVLNTWEAVYFDHRVDRLLALADAAADVGVERFVLDDGWFLGRRDDHRGLGDWTVDPIVWPHGLHPLVDHVRTLGLQFGLWVEPEMVNLDSDLVRAHPDWVLGPAVVPSSTWRNQHVLDVARPDVFAHLLERLDALVEEYSVDFLKWDHNRDVLTAVHADGRPAVHAVTSAVYRLIDALRSRHPGLEIESCSSGGGRVDLGILERTDRIWASDTNDPVERESVQRWTTLLVPPELVGAHVGPGIAHTTGRATGLTLRGITALFGHAGIECDLTALSQNERDQLRGWAGLYRELRGLLHSGEVVRADLPDAGALLHGVASASRDELLLAYVRLATSPESTPGRVLLPAVDRDRRYVLRVRCEAGAPWLLEARPPSWWDQALGEGFPADGHALAAVGLPFPVLGVGSGFLLHLTEAAP